MTALVRIPFNDRIATIFNVTKDSDGNMSLPHDLETTLLLRSENYDCPAPILSQYDFPVMDKTKPAFFVQKQTCAMLTTHKRAYVLNELGTGKTRCALWAFDYLRQTGLAHKMLVVCSISTMYRTWGKEITSEFDRFTWTVLYGSKEKRLKNLKKNVDIYIINHDGLETIYSEINKRLDIDCIVIDELSIYRNGGTNRTKIMKQFVYKKEWAWGMTGGPIPRHVTDVWGQAIILTPRTVPDYFSHLRGELCYKVGPFKWIPKPGAEEIAIKCLSPSVRFTLDEVTEIPPKRLQYYEVPMSAQQRDVYEALRLKAVALIDEHKIDALNAGAVMSKLLQISTGYVYTREGQIVKLENKERLQYTLDLIDGTNRKVIVFAPFKSALAGISEMLTANKVDHATIHGGITMNRRNVIFSKFQDTKHLKVLVAHPVCMAHGLTLTASNTIVWFGPTLSLEIFHQANGRITRVGQQYKQLIAMLGGARIERRIYGILAENEDLQDKLLRLIKEDTDEQITIDSEAA